jgi:hypothetical protein
MRRCCDAGEESGVFWKCDAVDKRALWDLLCRGASTRTGFRRTEARGERAAFERILWRLFFEENDCVFRARYVTQPCSGVDSHENDVLRFFIWISSAFGTCGWPDDQPQPHRAGDGQCSHRRRTGIPVLLGAQTERRWDADGLCDARGGVGAVAGPKP